MLASFHAGAVPDSSLEPLVSPVPVTDGELLMRYSRDGDEAALEEVIERHRAMVWGVCSRILARRADAEDAYQATLLILARKAGSVRANDSAAGWLFRVAHNAAIAARRRHKRRRESSLDESPPAAEEAFPDLGRQEVVAALLEELRALPAKYQAVLALRYLEGRSRREVAEALDSTVATIAGRLVRGRRMLRSRLARRGVSLGLALGVFGVGASSSAAGAVHAGAPAIDVSTLLAGSSTAVSAGVHGLVTQGVRSMFLASATKPAAVGLAAAVALVVLLVEPPEGVAGDEPLRLEAAVAEGESGQQAAGSVEVAAPQRRMIGHLRVDNASGVVTAVSSERGDEEVGPDSKSKPGNKVAGDPKNRQLVRDSELLSDEALPFRAGDALSIQVRGTRRVTSSFGVVDSEGRIDLGPSGVIRVAGRSVQEAVALIEEAYAATVKKPRVSIWLVGNTIEERRRAEEVPALDQAREAFAKRAREEEQRDLSQPSFEELYWQYEHWKAELEGSEKLVQVYRRSLERAETLAESNLTSETQVEQRKIALQTAQTKLPLARAKVAEFERLLKQAALRETQPQEGRVQSPAGSVRGWPVPHRLPEGPSIPSRASRGAVSPSEVPPEILSPGSVVLVDGTFPKNSVKLNERCLVEADGTIGLGAAIGRVKVGGLTMRQAEKAVQEHIDKDWEEVTIQLTPVQVPIPTFGLPKAYVPPVASTNGVAPVVSGKPPARGGPIQPGERLYIEVLDRSTEGPFFLGEVVVDPVGKVSLSTKNSRNWGRFEVRGLTPGEAEDKLASWFVPKLELFIDKRVKELAPDGNAPPKKPPVPEIRVQVVRVKPPTIYPGVDYPNRSLNKRY